MQHSTAGSFPVYTFMLEESLIFNRNCCLPKIIRHIFQIYPDTVFFSVDRLQFYPVSGFFILIINNGTEFHRIVIGIYLYGRLYGGIHILHENTEHHHTGTDSNQCQRKQPEENPSYDPPDTSGALCLLRPAGRLFFVFQSWFPPFPASCQRPFLQRPIIHQNIYSIVSSPVNIENVPFCRKKVLNSNVFFRFGQDRHTQSDILPVFFTPSSLAIGIRFR